MRRSHHALEKPATTVDTDGVMHYKHRATAETGKYRGRQVVDVEKKLEKKRVKQQKKLEEADSASE